MLQSIDTLRSLYENQVPVRFGVILYSTQLIKNIEDNGGQIQSYDAETNAHVKEDISTMVFTSLWNKFTAFKFPTLNFCFPH